MAVHGEDGALGARHALAQEADQRRVLLGLRVADRVRDVERRGAGLERDAEDLDQVVPIRARGVLGRELDVVAVAARLAHRAVDLGEHLLAAHAQLVLEVDVAGRDEGVDARAHGALERLRRALDVLSSGAREAADAGLLEIARHRAHRLEIALARDREARLDHVDAEPLELARERQLLVQVHAAARRLLAVAQRGVEDAQDLCSAHSASPLNGLALDRLADPLRAGASPPGDRSTRPDPRPRRAARSRTASRSAPARSARSRRPRRRACRRSGAGPAP